MIFLFSKSLETCLALVFAFGMSLLNMLHADSKAERRISAILRVGKSISYINRLRTEYFTRNKRCRLQQLSTRQRSIERNVET